MLVAMSRWIRFLGILNAGVWLGAGIFLTFGAGQAVFSPGVVESLGREKAGAVAQAILGRYFVMQYVCLAVAAVQLKLAGASIPGIRPWLTVGALAVLVSLGGFWLQPKLHDLNKIRYTMSLPEDQRKEAGASFGKLHGLSQVMNLVLLGVVFSHLCRVSRDRDSQVGKV